MTLKERIEKLVGSYADTAALDEWLKEGCRIVVQSLPVPNLWLVSQEISDAGTGAVVTTSRLLYAHKGGRRAREVPASMKAVFKDASSIHAASDFSPVFWKESGKAFVQGATAGGTVVAVKYPTPNSAVDTAIADFPDEIDQAVIYYAASLVQSTRATLLVAPTLSLPVRPAVADLDLSKKLDGVTALTVPSPPTAPAISYTNAAGTAVTATSIGALPAAPTYNKPALTLDFADFDAYAGGSQGEDPEMAGVELQKVRTQIEDYAADVQNASTELQKNIESYRAEVQKVIEQAQLTHQKAAQDAAQATDVSKQNAIYNFQAAVQDYELELRRYDAQVQEYGLDVQAVVKTYEANISQKVIGMWQEEASQKIQEHQSALSRYTAEKAALSEDAQRYHQLFVQALQSYGALQAE